MRETCISNPAHWVSECHGVKVAPGMKTSRPSSQIQFSTASSFRTGTEGRQTRGDCSELVQSGRRLGFQSGFFNEI